VLDDYLQDSSEPPNSETRRRFACICSAIITYDVRDGIVPTTRRSSSMTAAHVCGVESGYRGRRPGAPIRGLVRKWRRRAFDTRGLGAPVTFSNASNVTTPT